MRRRSKAEDAAKTIPPDTSCLGVREDRPPASEDAAGTWTASATGSVRKGFDCGVDSWAASAAAKASEWTEEGQERKVRTWRRSPVDKNEEREISACRGTSVSDEGEEEEKPRQDDHTARQSRSETSNH